MSKPVATSIQTEAPDSGAAVTVLPGLWVADGDGYRLATSGTQAAVFTADGSGHRLVSSAGSPTISARLLAFGSTFILRAVT